VRGKRDNGYRAAVPEGHVVHYYADRQQALLGPVTASSPQGRFADGAAVITEQRLCAVEAYGKHLFYGFDSAAVVHVHLGMQGVFADYEPGNAPQAEQQVRMRLAGARLVVDLRADADDDVVWRSFASSSAAAGAVLLDQQVIAGVGNVLRAEALHAVGIAPDRPACSLTRADFDRVWSAVVTLMRTSAATGRIEPRAVYKQEQCRSCEAPVRVGTVGGGRSYACDHCQS
jgi:endonuclease-8